MATETTERPAPGTAICGLVLEAREWAKNERRNDNRLPFFRPVAIHVGNGTCYSAFSRDISASSIGLLHNMTLPLADVMISVVNEQGQSVKQRARIAWCEPCGQGWYMSAGEFV
jgi:hypothetical protein